MNTYHVSISGIPSGNDNYHWGDGRRTIDGGKIMDDIEERTYNIEVPEDKEEREQLAISIMRNYLKKH